ncbi:MAG TPA: BTAD domain-containing putative transcriptional regulator, partial [Acidimicrobiia bacterium]
MIEIRVLGPIQGFRDGERVDLGGPTQRRLLAALVARPGETVSVTTLLEDLWGEDPPPSGPQSIQSYVSRLRSTLGSHVIETRAPGYRLGSDGLQVDGFEFLELSKNLPEDPAARLDAIDQALDLWAGPAFEGFDNVDFAVRRLDETRLTLEEERAHLLADSGRGAEALAVLERITSVERLRESAWLALARVLSRSGRQAEAVRKLDRYRESLADIGLEPGPDFARAQDEVFDSPRPPAPTPLPHVETSFVGRERELRDLYSLLEKHRLVTVTGPGGMGKSRLAIEALRDWHVLPLSVARLASLRSGSEVSPTVLTAVGGEARGDPLEAVVARISRTPTLLLLDNAEHVVEAAADLASVLLARTEERVLVTAREPLNVSGEMVLTLDSLSPEAAIALYRDRARQVFPAFEAPE